MPTEMWKPFRTGSRRNGAIEPADVGWEGMMPGVTGARADDESAYDDEDQLFTVLAFDPGGRTGWAVFCVHPDAMTEAEVKILDNILFWSAGEFGGREDEMVDAMIGLVESWPDRADIVVEDFIAEPGRTFMDREMLSPIRITAAFSYALRDTGWGRKRGVGAGRTPIMQMPVTAMSTVTDDRLRALGFWAPLAGAKDARAAVKHALTWLRRKKEFKAKLRRAEARRKA